MIRCPGCAREYDVTLFAFGRTISCTCGTRVGLEPRVEPERTPAEPRFVADAMLGRLARWLRVIGADTLYDPEIEDAELARIAIAEGRIALTRDRALTEEWRIPRVLLLRSDAPLEQLAEVAERFGLDWRGRLFRRCSLCNCALARVSKDEAAQGVPERVLREGLAFARCPGCRRFYWEGSHTRRMRGILARTLG